MRLEAARASNIRCDRNAQRALPSCCTARSPSEVRCASQLAHAMGKPSLAGLEEHSNL